MLLGVIVPGLTEVGAPDGAANSTIRVRYYEMFFSPSSLVIAATALLTGPLPAAWNTLTVMVYTFPGSAPVIV